jgi:hypothetical protein
VGKPAVEFYGGQVSPVEHIAIFVVTAAAIAALTVASGQPVSSLNVQVVPPLKDRVQPGGVQRQ